MTEPTAEIVEPKIAGNYSARKQNRWVHHSLEKDAPAGDVAEEKTVPPHVREDVDEIHKTVSRFHVSPAQLYSTDSGKLYHAGSICIVMVGPPARGKTNLSISLCRYLRWLGVRANLFHLGDYRRSKTTTVPFDFFDPKPESEEAKEVRQQLIKLAMQDVLNFFQNDMGQVAIYDAVNGVSSERRELAETMQKANVKVVFIESLIDDKELLESNIADAAQSPDYLNWDEQEAIEDYKKRIAAVEHSYDEMNEEELTYIKFVNFGEKLLVNKSKHDFLTTKIIFYLMNSKIKKGSIYFARCSNNKLDFKSDPPLDAKGRDYAKKLSSTMVNHFKSRGYDSLPSDLFVWTSVRLRTTQLAQVFKDMGLNVKHRPEMTQMNPGDADGLTDEQLKTVFPEDYKKHLLDPYHHRYPRAECYHDLALKLEPLIMEIERMTNDVLVIADETIIRVFYGYLMASSSSDIPFLEFPQSEIIKITYNAYMNQATRFKIEGLEGV
ncbi:hypothetical protein OGAPHI_000863 [Ogataea philodendri]|uniref:6-phosphofructo-2-kinase domain-containing protein n=1 Tax=Ogataea philodendri TaxID=1378263 RepID=A0A9P8PFZ5_9ASCO|nr:uncharacterized protein OGAPHI_000863 [Ogataea philodendri]KAH3671152.1 hypothetical protein OGAPHI_000863 [Ogataea philodendri]